MKTRTTLSLMLVLALFGSAACADEAGQENGMETPDAAADASELPEPVEWDVRLDDPEADQGGFQFSEEGGEFRVETGPAAITYQDEQLVSGGDFRAGGTFVEQEAPADHREAYGIFFGGRNLQSPGVRYGYFLVRGTGEYLIKSRDGESTETVVDWTSSDAVRGTGEGGTSENALAVAVRGDSIHFSVNGQTVETVSTEEINPYGVVGFRVNHRLSLRVRDWNVQGEMVGQESGGAQADTAGR